MKFSVHISDEADYNAWSSVVHMLNHRVMCRVGTHIGVRQHKFSDECLSLRYKEHLCGSGGSAETLPCIGKSLAGMEVHSSVLLRALHDKVCWDLICKSDDLRIKCEEYCTLRGWGSKRSDMICACKWIAVQGQNMENIKIPYSLGVSLSDFLGENPTYGVLNKVSTPFEAEPSYILSKYKPMQLKKGEVLVVELDNLTKVARETAAEPEFRYCMSSGSSSELDPNERSDIILQYAKGVDKIVTLNKFHNDLTSGNKLSSLHNSLLYDKPYWSDSFTQAIMHDMSLTYDSIKHNISGGKGKSLAIESIDVLPEK